MCRRWLIKYKKNRHWFLYYWWHSMIFSVGIWVSTVKETDEIIVWHTQVHCVEKENAVMTTKYTIDLLYGLDIPFQGVHPRMISFDFFLPFEGLWYSKQIKVYALSWFKPTSHPVGTQVCQIIQINDTFFRFSKTPCNRIPRKSHHFQRSTYQGM